jgi:hypothetical protein
MRRGVPWPQRKLRPDAPAPWDRQRAQARLIRQGTLTSVMGKAVVKTVQAIPKVQVCSEHAYQIGA